jgi:hydrogenase maturation protease
VIGLGNPLRGDDGIGPAVVGALRPCRRPGVTLAESTGDDLPEMLLLEAFDRVVVVDAAELGRRPGSHVWITPDDLAASPALASSHVLNLIDALALVAALGVRRPPVEICAVQPASVGWRPGLSRAARRAVAKVAAEIREALDLPRPTRRPRTVLRQDQDVRSLRPPARPA